LQVEINLAFSKYALWHIVVVGLSFYTFSLPLFEG
jgi:hypothetical protein